MREVATIGAHVEAWRQSGQSKRAYNEQRELPYWSMRYWANKLAESDCGKSQRLVELEPAGGGAEHGRDQAPIELVVGDPGIGMRLAYEHAADVIGSVSERTIARHLGWVRRLVAASVLEAGELLVELAPFAALPEVRAGRGGLAELRRLHDGARGCRSLRNGSRRGRRRARSHRLPASALHEWCASATRWHYH